MKRIIIPIRVVSDIKEMGVHEILKCNGFDMQSAIVVHHDMHKLINVYEQEGD